MVESDSEVRERMKITKKSPSEIEAEVAKLPTRRVGQWTELCEKVKSSGKPLEVTEITTGQLAALKRTAKLKGVTVRGTDKGTRAFILPVVPEK